MKLQMNTEVEKIVVIDLILQMLESSIGLYDGQKKVLIDEDKAWLLGEVKATDGGPQGVGRHTVPGAAYGRGWSLSPAHIKQVLCLMVVDS